MLKSLILMGNIARRTGPGAAAAAGSRGKVRSPGVCLFVTGLLVAAAAAQPAAGADPVDPAGADSSRGARYSVPEIVVRAARPVTVVGGAGAVEVRVDSLALPAAPNLEQVLRELPALHVRTNSRGEAELSTRGSESRQVAVLVDGVPLTLAWDARADVSVLPATAPREIVFVRGLSSLLHGPNVLGGILEARVARSFAQPERGSLQLAAGADDVGSFGGTVAGALPLQTRRGAWLLRAGAGYRETPGQTLADDVREPVPDEDGLRLNTDAQSVDGFLAARFRAAGGAWLSLAGTAFQAERGIAAQLGVEDSDARLWRYPHVSRTLAVLSVGTGERRTPLGRGSLEAAFGHDRGRTEIDAYASRAYADRIAFEGGEDRGNTVRVQGTHLIGPRGELRAAFTHAELRHDETLRTFPADEATDGRFRYRQRLWSAGAETLWQLIQDRDVDGPLGVRSLNLSAGGAWDVATTPQTGGRERQDRLDEWGARAGASLALGRGHLVLHAGASRRGRFPALRELYSGALSTFVPNPDLKPETLVALETGVTARNDAGEVQAVVFHHRLSDAVVRIRLDGAPRRFMRVNRNELESVGLELIGSRLVGPAAFSGHLTWQDVQLTDTEADRTNRPENLPEIIGGAEAEVSILAGLRASAGIEFQGRQYAIDPRTGEDAELADGAVVRAAISRQWPVPAGWGETFKRLETRIAVDNAADRPVYDAFGLPRPGRRVRFEVRAH